MNRIRLGSLALALGVCLQLTASVSYAYIGACKEGDAGKPCGSVESCGGKMTTNTHANGQKTCDCTCQLATKKPMDSKGAAKEDLKKVPVPVKKADSPPEKR